MALKDTQMSLRVVPAYEVEAEAPEGGLLSDRIRNALTDAIAAGHLASGTALDEQEIADRYGASRTPVREA
ncbi:GntR family transcriptional regulator, partial [Raoultella ornithinolytica]